jgi:hypothetical protein
MPSKSQAQRRKFAQLLVEGKISNETFESGTANRWQEAARARSRKIEEVEARRRHLADRERQRSGDASPSGRRSADVLWFRVLGGWPPCNGSGDRYTHRGSSCHSFSDLKAWRGEAARLPTSNP